MIYRLIAITFIIYYINLIKCDANLQRSFETELKINRNFRSYVGQLATTLTDIEIGLAKMSLSKWNHINKEDCVSSPLSAMTMVRRLVQDWSPLTASVGRFSKLHHLQLNTFRWPTIADLDEAARAVMRSQMTYDLSTALLVRGVQTDVFLTNVTAADYFEIARQYFQKRLFPEAKEWLQHALAGVHDTDDAPSRETVLYYLAAAHCFTGEIVSSRNILRGILKENPLSNPPRYVEDYYNVMGAHGCMYPDEKMYKHLDQLYFRSETQLPTYLFYLNNTAIKEHSRLCRGEVKTDNRLVCRYVHYQKPHLRFQPFKLEELQLDPPVVRFYDIVSDKEAEILRNQAKEIMVPALTGPSTVSEFRTSHVAWLRPNRTEWLSRRISDASQLDSKYAENNQVSRYSVSGEYMPHNDFMERRWPIDRIATFMIYLNEVRQGGNTMFTKWNLSVPPVKNSAVMWFNYKPNGEPDRESEHCGCPVLVGTKWVLNKWFRNAGNGVNFPCSTDQHGSFKGFYL